MKYRKMRRRLIPLSVALLDLLIWIVLASLTLIDESTADKWTLFNLAIGYLVKSIIFWYMRRRMVGDRRELTIFGYALADFFLALTILAIFFFLVTSSMYLYLLFGDLQPFSIRLANRLLINFGVWLTNGTGVAVLYEMRRAESSLNVHIEEGG